MLSLLRNSPQRRRDILAVHFLHHEIFVTSSWSLILRRAGTNLESNLVNKGSGVVIQQYVMFPKMQPAAASSQ
jgi:hypothetical protein